MVDGVPLAGRRLAALYESWAVPFAVLFAVPIGIFGAMTGLYFTGLANNIYAQIGLVLLIGLAAKNAILIVEFAADGERRGLLVWDAVLEAARLRLRPILMTSLAFVAGVVPLAVATGAGSGSQHAIGTGVIGGMISATLLAIFFVPLFFVVVERIFKPKHPGHDAAVAQGDASSTEAH